MLSLIMCFSKCPRGGICKGVQVPAEVMDLEYMQLWASAYLWVMGIEPRASAVRTLNGLAISVTPAEQIF